MNVPSIEFKDSIDKLVLAHSPRDNANGIETSRMSLSPSKKVVFINEEKNETHIIQHEGDPLYKFELKQPKKGILRSKRAATENFTARVQPFDEEIESSINSLHERNLNKAGAYSPNLKYAGQNILQEGHLYQQGESPRANLFKISLNLTNGIGKPELKARGYSPIFSQSLDKLKEKTSVLRPNNRIGAMETFYDYYNQYSEKTPSVKLPENKGRTTALSLTPSRDLVKNGSTVLKDVGPVACGRQSSPDLNYIPIQNTHGNHLRTKKAPLNPGTRDIVAQNIPLTDRGDYSSNTTANQQSRNLSLLASVSRNDNKKADSLQFDINNKLFETLDKRAEQLGEDNISLLQRLKAPRKLHDRGGYQFMASYRAPRDTPDFSRDNTSGLNIEKIPIATDKELLKEFEYFNSNLIDTNLDWSKRLAALKKLQGIIFGGAWALNSFPGFISKLSNHLSMQMNDLRSAISKEAVKALCLAAKLARDRLEPLCDKIFAKDALMKLVNSANKILADGGHMCIVYMIECVQSPKFIGKIAEELNSKNVSVREKVTFYLSRILSSYPINIIEKHMGVLETAIMIGISDASKIARANSRKAYRLYAKQLPQRAEKIYHKFDYAVQKALNDEPVPEDDSTERFGNFETDVSPLKAKKSLEIKKVTPIQTRPSTAKPPKISQSTKNSDQNSRNYYKNEKTLDRKNSSSSINTEGTRDSSARYEEDTRGRGILTAKMDYENRRNSDQLVKDTRKDSGGVDAKDKKPPIRHTRAPTTLTTNKRPSKSPNRDDNSNKVEKPKSTPKSSFLKTSNSASKTKLLTSSFEDDGDGYPEFNKENFESSAVLDKSVREMKEEISFEEAPKTKKPERISHLYYEKQDFQKNMKENDLKFLVDKCSDKNWATRFNSFEKIKEFLFELSPLDKIDPANVDKLVVAHSSRIADENSKVAVVCIESLFRVLSLFRERSKKHLTPILSGLIQGHLDTREIVRVNAEFIIEDMRANYSADELTAAYLPVLQNSRIAAEKAAVISQILLMLPGCEEYFQSPNNVHQYVTALTDTLVAFSKVKEVYLPALEATACVKDLNTKITLGLIIQLPQEQLSIIRSLSKEHLAKLNEDIQDYLQRNRLTQTPTEITPSRKAAQTFGREQNLWARDSSHTKQLSFEGATRTPKDGNSSYEHDENLDVNSKNQLLYQFDTPVSQLQNNRLSERHLSNSTDTNSAIQGKKIQNLSPNLDQSTQSMNSMVMRNKSGYFDLETLEILIMNYKENKSVWTNQLNFILKSLFKIIEYSGPRVSELGLDLLVAALGLPIEFTQCLNELMEGILSIVHIHYKNATLDSVWQKLHKLNYKDQILEFMLSALGELDSPVCQVVIKEITILLGTISFKEAQTQLKLLFNQYKEIINHTDPDIRKSVVFSVVDLSLCYGDPFDVYIKQLSASHQKLISIYLQRKKQMKSNLLNLSAYNY